MIEEGSWKARARESALGTASTGREQIGIDFEILEGPNVGHHITWYGYFTEETWERTIESLRTCGWGGSDLSELGSPDGSGRPAAESGLDANEVRIVIAHEPDLQGEYRARVKWVNSVGGVAMKDRMDVGAAKAFAQKMRGRILALGAQQGQPRQQKQNGQQAQRPTAATPAQSAPDDDNIPF